MAQLERCAAVRGALIRGSCAYRAVSVNGPGNRGSGFGLRCVAEGLEPAALAPAAAPRTPAAPVVPRPTLAAGTQEVNPKDGLTYVWIPPGKFQMGCSPGDAEC